MGCTSDSQGVIMGRKSVWIVFVLFVLLSSSFGNAADAPIKLKFANFIVPGSRNSILFGEFVQEMNKKSNGKLEISYYTGSTLLTASKMAAGIATGIADIGISHCSYSRGRFPVMEVHELPLGYPSTWVGAHVVNEFYEKFKPKEWDQYHPLLFCMASPNIMQTVNKPFKTLEDIKGSRIRGTGRIADIVKAMGASPMPIEMPDVYEALRRNAADGILISAEVLKGFKIGELIKFVNTTSLKIGGSFCFYVTMNKGKWDSLSDDMKKLFTDVSKDYMEKWALAFNEMDIEAMEFFKGQGGQIVTSPDAESARWVKAVEPVITDYKKDLASKGYREQEVDTWISFIKERIEYWKVQEKTRNIPTAYEY